MSRTLPVIICGTRTAVAAKERRDAPFDLWNQRLRHCKVPMTVASKASASNSISHAVSNALRRKGAREANGAPRGRSVSGIADDVRHAHESRLRDHESIAHVIVRFEHQQRAGALVGQVDGAAAAEAVRLVLAVADVMSFIAHSVDRQYITGSYAVGRAAIDEDDVVLTDELHAFDDGHNAPVHFGARRAQS